EQAGDHESGRRPTSSVHPFVPSLGVAPGTTVMHGTRLRPILLDLLIDTRSVSIHPAAISPTAVIAGEPGRWAYPALSFPSSMNGPRGVRGDSAGVPAGPQAGARNAVRTGRSAAARARLGSAPGRLPVCALDEFQHLDGVGGVDGHVAGAVQGRC